MLEDILKLLRSDDRHPLKWPRPRGIAASTMGIMSGTLVLGELVLSGLSSEDQKEDFEDVQPMKQEVESAAQANNKENYAEVMKRKKRPFNGTEPVAHKENKEVSRSNVIAMALLKRFIWFALQIV
ncbi:unnamed protein product [Cylicocyclus nassatus]|uniref:Uncharacterized protein n=1 Tax=Cylicocyclus nassatus TaxID=53992 RepID=A0AA36DUA6_CYLNA|nr:unnamed protein product [Cylicocyclus nassatus]